ncbi:RNA polymerase sigma factor [Microbacterium ulmi]|uniref:Sigma-70 family RNA polymerase sigma factor n=1 Tax=Microbacterium ulmi TaxID=179095 RepID=A0A7Y2PZW3_9MICO|nr:sigma-70 family RNA polymerase sigma factor [Microbacterium ulmi]NII69483.1 RNA polymerase sigma-70 factor (ECF subfamily) [Microbacterium ulmi]NNH04916.1 sigma-70 family RNA polymerase sigma factor [Microbacterium ulmi]
MYDTDSDGELIRLAQRGDRGAFGALYARHGKAVYLYAWAMTRDDRDAEDVTQEVFIVAWRKLRGIRIVERSALPWLLVTCRNLSRNALRARRDALELDESLLPGDRTRHERIEELSWVRQAVERLGGLDQRVIHLCLVEGYSYAVAADHLGLSTSAVAKRVERARAAVRLAVRGES